MQNEIEITFAGARERLIGGVPANERGAKDGLDNFPTSTSSEASPYQLDVQHRAWEVAAEIEAAAREKVRQELETLSLNPYAVPGAGAVERCRAATADALGAMDARLQEDHHKLMRARDRANEKQRERDHDFHLADAKAPPRGWPNKWASLNTLMILAACEFGAAYLVLEHALGPVAAATWSAVGPLVTMMLGGLAGYLSLLPANQAQRRSLGVYGRRFGAVLAAIMAVVVMYCISAYRSILIDGLSGTGAEIWMRGTGEAYKMAQPETLVLAILGLLGFVVSYRKVRGYFGDFTPRIREVDLACAEAQADLLRERESTIAYVIEPPQQAMENLADQLGAVRGWATKVVESSDRITTYVLEHNEALHVLNDALDSVDQEYRRSNVIVRSAPAPNWLLLPSIGNELTLPETITESRARGAEIARAWSAASDVAFAELNRAIRDAIAFIDGVAGVVANSFAGTAVAALSWRKM